MPDLTVSVNAYQDADLLRECLASVREWLPHVPIRVVDGRYSTWPDAPDNSTDGILDVCDAYTATYHPDGPFEDEAAKHRHRRDMVDTDRVLFLDADERLLSANMDALERDSEGAEFRVRIFNALMYGPRISYYPRLFHPDSMSVKRVDKFMLDGVVKRTDAITVVHRADLRDSEYRKHKLDRFDAEGRDPWYRDYLEHVRSEGHDAVFQQCPICGFESVTQSRVTGYGQADPSEFSRVECCTRRDGCYRSIQYAAVGEYQYLPGNIRQGFEEDIERVQLELMDAGYDLAKVVPTDAFERYLPNAVRWVEEEYDYDPAPAQTGYGG